MHNVVKKQTQSDLTHFRATSKQIKPKTQDEYNKNPLFNHTKSVNLKKALTLFQEALNTSELTNFFKDTLIIETIAHLFMGKISSQDFIQKDNSIKLEIKTKYGEDSGSIISDIINRIAIELSLVNEENKNTLSKLIHTNPHETFLFKKLFKEPPQKTVDKLLALLGDLNELESQYGMKPIVNNEAPKNFEIRTLENHPIRLEQNRAIHKINTQLEALRRTSLDPTLQQNLTRIINAQNMPQHYNEQIVVNPHGEGKVQTHEDILQLNRDNAPYQVLNSLTPKNILQLILAGIYSRHVGITEKGITILCRLLCEEFLFKQVPQPSSKSVNTYKKENADFFKELFSNLTIHPSECNLTISGWFQAATESDIKASGNSYIKTSDLYDITYVNKFFSALELDKNVNIS